MPPPWIRESNQDRGLTQGVHSLRVQTTSTLNGVDIDKYRLSHQKKKERQTYYRRISKNKHRWTKN